MKALKLVAGVLMVGALVGCGGASPGNDGTIIVSSSLTNWPIGKTGKATLSSFPLNDSSKITTVKTIDISDQGAFSLAIDPNLKPAATSAWPSAANCTLTFTASDAKFAVAYLTPQANGLAPGSITVTNRIPNSVGDVTVSLMYADKDVVVDGKCGSDTFNKASFKAGWNRVLYTIKAQGTGPTQGENTVITDFPSNIKWFYSGPGATAN